MNVNVIKLEDGRIEVDGVVYERVTPIKEEKIREWCETHKITESDSKCGHDIIDGVDYITIPLPAANADWTFEAWDLAKKCCSDFSRAFPYHSRKFSHNKVYIMIEEA